MEGMTNDRDIRNRSVVNNVREILERRGLSQRDFARLIGKNEAEVSRWFSGRVSISHRSQQKIEQALAEPISADSTYRLSVEEIRIGLIGTGNIAGRFMREVVHVNGVRVTAAFNPREAEVERFCRQYGIERCTSDIAELLAGVDAVYIASPVNTHFEYARMALENGCHVLCEMPFVNCRSEVDQLYRLAMKRGLTLMPALKTSYCPSFQQMIMVAQSGIIGEVTDISATVTNLLPDDVDTDFANERMMENFSYPLLVFFKLLGLEYRHLHSFVKANGGKVLFTHTYVEYDRAVGSFKVGVGVKSEGSLVISGTNGYIYVPAPWWKPDYFEARFENPADNKKYFFPYEADGLRYEIQAFADRICHRSSAEYVRKADIMRMTEIQNRIIRKN